LVWDFTSSLYIKKKFFFSLLLSSTVMMVYLICSSTYFVIRGQTRQNRSIKLYTLEGRCTTVWERQKRKHLDENTRCRKATGSVHDSKSLSSNFLIAPWWYSSMKVHHFRCNRKTIRSHCKSLMYTVTTIKLHRNINDEKIKYWELIILVIYSATAFALKSVYFNRVVSKSLATHYS